MQVNPGEFLKGNHMLTIDIKTIADSLTQLTRTMDANPFGAVMMLAILVCLAVMTIILWKK